MGLIGWGDGKIGLQEIAYIDFEFGWRSCKYGFDWLEWRKIGLRGIAYRFRIRQTERQYGFDWLGRRMNKLARNGV